ncbi:class I SAM-dependent methyltransferase [uncultured Methylobacterium sp.]|uniref:class I SAM-dependent methyltransferase n=1 Tax=uncultured Methylobacterium sp. TaxID=157278 RepID=UPI0035CBA049
MSGTPLGREIAGTIRETGPIGIDRYMALCLGHPVHGYYRTRDPLGPRGDFTTAPEISQMFGELIGVWIAAVWGLMAAPAPLRLVELGPGRGTLMADALRALRAVAPTAGIDLHLVETSPVLRAAQAVMLAEATPAWHADAEAVPPGPAIWIANEFLDCLPVRQFQATPRGWCERVVGFSADGALAFGLAPEPTRTIAARAPEGVVMTLPTAVLDLTRSLARRLGDQGGALLAIDYGHVRPGFGDTLQAVAGHRFVGPLDAPGEADLTVHVDFSAVARAARAEGAAIHGPVDQRDFLRALGLAERRDRLKARATPAQAAAIDAAAARLTDPSRRGMGSLFKAMAVSAPGLPPLPGFPKA